jgi:hypothetical protein
LLCSIYGGKIKIEDHYIFDYWNQVDRNEKVELPTEEHYY